MPACHASLGADLHAAQMEFTAAVIATQKCT